MIHMLGQLQKGHAVLQTIIYHEHNFKIFCVDRTYLLCMSFQKVILLNVMKEVNVKLWGNFL